ncbi:MAG: hypothetical protein FD180_2155 [Planctomycetota bacterium]|nr:MAG: hypothetical protein FD180_2155 [Planctomycetota bacterium]
MSETRIDWRFDAVSVKTAYRAMLVLLAKARNEEGFEDLGEFQAGLQLLTEDRTFDPDRKQDWLRAIDEAREQEKQEELPRD